MNLCVTWLLRDLATGETHGLLDLPADALARSIWPEYLNVAVAVNLAACDVGPKG